MDRQAGQRRAGQRRAGQRRAGQGAVCDSSATALSQITPLFRRLLVCVSGEGGAAVCGSLLPTRNTRRSEPRQVSGETRRGEARRDEARRASAPQRGVMIEGATSYPSAKMLIELLTNGSSLLRVRRADFNRKGRTRSQSLCRQFSPGK